MSLPDPAFKDLDPMMRHLEAAIDNSTATPQLLAAMQRRLDAIDIRYRDDPAVAGQYHKLVELQALIHGTNHKDHEAQKFIAGAIQLAGGVDALSSRLLKTYVRNHPASGAASPPPAPVPPLDTPEPTAQEIQFINLSLPRLLLLSIFTAGLYDLYWAYKNWQYIKLSTGQKMWPFWRAVFLLFWIWPLCKRVFTAAQQQGYTRRWSPGLVALTYIVLAIATNIVNSVQTFNLIFSIVSVVLLVVSILPLLVVQQAMNFMNAQHHARKKKTTGPEIIVIVVGFLLFILYMLSLFVPMDKLESAMLPSNHTALAQQQEKIDSFTKQYETCAADLEARADQVDTTDPEAVDAYNADLAACDDVRVKQNEAVDAYEALKNPAD